MNKVLTPEQIKFAMQKANVRLISQECGVGYNTCQRLSTYEGEWDYNTSTLKAISAYLLEEHEKLSEVYGLK